MYCFQIKLFAPKFKFIIQVFIVHITTQICKFKMPQVLSHSVINKILEPPTIYQVKQH